MINAKFGWEWMRFHFFTNKMNSSVVANVEFRPFGFELYRGHNSTLLYLELVIGTLMVKFNK